MDRAETIFHESLEVEGFDERRDVARRACGADRALMGQVERLLLLHEDAERRFPSEPGGRGDEAFSSLLDEFALTEDAGTQIGRYKLLERLGEGGFGSVWAAEQREPVRRRVALKIIKLGMDTQQVVARFEAERQALALMDHPNIAKVLDAGATDSGRPFFVMELVRGIAITKYCDQQELSAKARLELFIKVCRAVQHAHQKGVIHRDIKPSNVMVTLHDGIPVPKVIDFGIAKATEQELTEKTIYTRYGQFIGTPAYMSPEQAEMSGLDIDTRSDIYSLGVLLYELLTGATPFSHERLHSGGYAEMQKIIIEEEPTRPSTLMSQMDMGSRADSVKRGLEPDALIKELKGDLDWIVLKTIEKDRNRRYETPNGLAADIMHYLNDEPVTAVAPSLSYQCKKFYRKNQMAVRFATAVVVLIITLAVGAIIAAFRIQHALQVAQTYLYGADLNMVQAALENADLVHARELLDRHRPQAGGPDQRGFEWRYLWNLCQGDEKLVLEPLIQSPRRVVFSHDGRLLAAGNSSAEPSPVVWSASTNAVVKTLPQGDRPVAFAPHGPILVTAGKNGLKLWNTQSWEAQFLVPSDDYAAAVFSPDGRWLIVHGSGLQVWDTQTWDLVETNDDFGEINFWVTATLSVSGDSTLLSCARGLPYASAGEVGIFRLPSLEPVPWRGRLPEDVSAAAFHSERDLLVTGGWSGDIRLWDTTSGQELHSIMKHTTLILAMAFSPAEADLLATTGGDRSVHLWDLASQKERSRLHGASDSLMELAFSPDGQTIATGGHRNPITLWDVAQTKADIIAVPTEPQNCILGFSGDGRQLTTIDTTGQVTFRDPITLAVQNSVCRVDIGSALLSPPAVDFGALPIVSSRDTRLVGVGTMNGLVEIWDLTSCTKKLLNAHSKRVRGLAFSPESDKLITGGDDHEIHLWDLTKLSRIASAQLDEIPNPYWPLCIQYSPNGDTVAVGSGSKLSILQASDLHRLHQFPDLSFTSLRFSPDGTQLATGHTGGKLIVWNTHNWNPTLLPGHELFIPDITFSPDGRRMVSGGDKLIVWDTDTWQQLANYKLPVQDINHITFSPDGNDLLTSDPYALRVWRAASDHEIKDREARFGRWGSAAAPKR